MPAREAAVAVADVDLPALATENAGGLWFTSARRSSNPARRATRDERVIVLPLRMRGSSIPT
jgi:hypothetical protein